MDAYHTILHNAPLAAMVARMAPGHDIGVVHDEGGPSPRRILADIAQAIGLEVEDMTTAAAAAITGDRKPAWFRQWTARPRPTLFVIGDVDRDGFSNLVKLVNAIRAHADPNVPASIAIVTGRNPAAVAVAVAHDQRIDTRDVLRA